MFFDFMDRGVVVRIGDYLTRESTECQIAGHRVRSGVVECRCATGSSSVSVWLLPVLADRPQKVEKPPLS